MYHSNFINIAGTRIGPSHSRNLRFPSTLSRRRLRLQRSDVWLPWLLRLRPSARSIRRSTTERRLRERSIRSRGSTCQRPSESRFRRVSRRRPSTVVRWTRWTRCRCWKSPTKCPSSDRCRIFRVSTEVRRHRRLFLQFRIRVKPTCQLWLIPRFWVLTWGSLPNR